MKDGRHLSKKDLLQISVCQYLLAKNSYVSQQEIRQSMQQYGFTGISQATISRLLKHLGVVKVRNARGVKVYSVVQPQQNFCLPGSLAEMIVSVEHNQQFILVRTPAACASYVAAMLKQQMFSGILGIIYNNDTLWIAPVYLGEITDLYQQIKDFLEVKHSGAYPLMAELSDTADRAANTK